MSKSLINPFELLGVNEKSTIKEARKSYYQLALLCHPDCGGHEESMKILSNAYSFVETQLKNKNDISKNIGEDLEKEFEEFNKNVKTEIPKMTDLYDMTKEEDNKNIEERNFKEYNERFNKEFQEEQKYQFEELVSNNAFSQGYGDDHDNDTDEEYVMPTKIKFESEIQVYKEPHILPDDYGKELRMDFIEVKDFSNYKDHEYDYVKAHTELKNEPRNLKSEMDKPIEDLEEATSRLELERGKLKLTYNQIDLILKNDCDEEFIKINHNN